MSTETETTKEAVKEPRPKRFHWNRLIRTDIQGVLSIFLALPSLKQRRQGR
mgnify:CR=1 FL=1